MLLNGFVSVLVYFQVGPAGGVAMTLQSEDYNLLPLNWQLLISAFLGKVFSVTDPSVGISTGAFV